MKTRSMYKAERMSLDRLPEPVLETILCCLPTDDAARTSILSREWRYKWTTIPNLEFELKYMDMHDLHQVLLRRQGPIHELTLFMEGYWMEDPNLFEFNQIIRLLLRNHTIKKLRLDAWDFLWNELPKSVFALHHLTDLSLCSFVIDLPSIFNGLGSLGKLELSDVEISTQTLRRLLSNCPSLTSLSLYIGYSDDKCTINELLKCLPVIEHLTISSDVCDCEWLVLDSVLQELPTSLIHMKLLRLERMSFVEGSRLAFLLALIKCSPNLERLELEMACRSNGSAVKDEYSDVWLEHLKELHICFRGNSDEMKSVMEFVKFILVRSPKLKKVTVFSTAEYYRESVMVKTLLEAPRASPAVIITLNDFE